MKRTGDKRPKPFVFEKEMHDLLQGDPAFKPVVVRISFGVKEVNNNVVTSLPVSDDENDNDDSSVSVSSRSTSSVSSSNPSASKKKRKVDDHREYLEKRDDKFFKALKEMQETQNKLIETLIDKFPN